uniref:Uncharacterized protein n=1 Tax=Rhipicephalus zambeziensis TaxID=60191 RepID=A0A224YBB5_9ACAR
MATAKCLGSGLLFVVIILLIVDPKIQSSTFACAMSGPMLPSSSSLTSDQRRRAVAMAYQRREDVLRRMARDAQRKVQQEQRKRQHQLQNQHRQSRQS